MFTSPIFWLALLITWAVLQLLGDRRNELVRPALAVTSAAALFATLDDAWPALLIIAATIGWMWVSLRALLAKGRTGSFASALVGIAPVVAVWVLGKLLVTAAAGGFATFVFIGISYALVKAYTLTKDVLDKRIPLPAPVDMAAYFLFFPTFVAGPMHTYGEFHSATLNRPKYDASDAVNIVFRFLLGLAKVQVIVPILRPLSLVAVARGGDATPMELLLASFVFSFVLLFDFSGYSDMAIASARLLGVATPENFRFPYIAASIREFWQRWHITFSRVLTGYIFIPLTRTLQRRNIRNRTVVSAVGYLVTFLFAGYWHGATPNFLLWGLYHAAGLFFYDVYRSSRNPVSAAGNGVAIVGRIAGMAVTFVFVSVGWILFTLPLERLLEVLR